jgi:predicted heme/steroid binding protein
LAYAVGIGKVQVDGVVYRLHLDRAYKHARHYTGWTSDLSARLDEHAHGHGARLLAVVAEHGIGWRLARTWPGTRGRERQPKTQGGAARRCPMCGVMPRQSQQGSAA